MEENTAYDKIYGYFKWDDNTSKAYLAYKKYADKLEALGKVLYNKEK